MNFFKLIIKIISGILAGMILFFFVLPSILYLMDNHENKSAIQRRSASEGTVSKGSLVNSEELPCKGDNFEYFSKFSYYLLGRAYVNDKVKKAVLSTYNKCQSIFPDRKFILMECSNKDGGKMYPHRTHQNGLSIDFGTPLLKNGKPYDPGSVFNLYGYAVDFDSEGRLESDEGVLIDFETMAQHIFLLQEACKDNGLKIEKVIFKIPLQHKLFNTFYGSKIKDRIYFVKALTPMLNQLHDDHYHIDFKVIR